MTIDDVMEQVQIFASCYALVGGRFDDGTKMQQSEAEKTLLRKMIAEVFDDAVSWEALYQRAQDAAGALADELERRSPAAKRYKARVRHKKRGSTYVVVDHALVQTDRPLADHAKVVVYRSEDDFSLWVRPASEFEDGRFEPAPTPSSIGANDQGSNRETLEKVCRNDPENVPKNENIGISGWQSMDTAPLDGKHCILSVQEGAFIVSVQGFYHGGKWIAVHRDNVQPLAWMPNVLLPDALCPPSFRNGALNTSGGKP